jgi:hypothetical protein
MLRLATVYDDWIGHPGGPTDEPVTAQVNERYMDAQCWVVRMHGGECADVYHLLNGPDGSTDAGEYLLDDHTHLNQEGHHFVADELARLGIVRSADVARSWSVPLAASFKRPADRNRAGTSPVPRSGSRSACTALTDAASPWSR